MRVRLPTWDRMADSFVRISNLSGPSHINFWLHGPSDEGKLATAPEYPPHLSALAAMLIMSAADLKGDRVSEHQGPKENKGCVSAIREFPIGVGLYGPGSAPHTRPPFPRLAQPIHFETSVYS